LSLWSAAGLVLAFLVLAAMAVSGSMLSADIEAADERILSCEVEAADLGKKLRRALSDSALAWQKEKQAARSMRAMAGMKIEESFARLRAEGALRALRDEVAKLQAMTSASPIETGSIEPKPPKTMRVRKKKRAKRPPPCPHPWWC
jgi:hypothetical protein